MKHPAPFPAQPKRRLLARFRQWHKWGGLLAGAVLLVVGGSGIVLNYKQPIFAALGLERNYRDLKPARGEPVSGVGTRDATAGFTTATGLAAAGVSVDRALALARETWGEAQLERFELRTERGELVYKIKERGGAELWINATTGGHVIRREYERVKTKPGGEVAARTTDWGKILIDLHTGKIGGEFGKAIMSGAALLLLFLTASGFYLWAKPLWARRRAAAAAAARSNPPTENGKPPSATPSAAA